MKKISSLLFFSLLKIFLFQKEESNLFLVQKAKTYGYDLTNPEDPFFHDICLSFKYIKKDITLNYRRKFYFFPSDKNSLINKKLISQEPKRNNTNDCFTKKDSNIWENITFIILMPIFFIQFSLLFFSLCLYIDNSINNTPFKKLTLMKKNKNFKNKEHDNGTFVKFIPEKVENTNKFTNDELQETENNQTNSGNNNIDLLNQKVQNDSNTNAFDSINKKESSLPFIDDDNTKENNNNNNNNNDKISEPSAAVEKSKENYTFGMQLGKSYKFSSNDNINNSKNDEKKSSENEKKIETKEEKMKRIKYIYEQMNQNIRKKKSNDDINADTPITIPKKDVPKVYLREEYFYFGYLLARMEDKRSVFQIYIDLLEQCQIFFKFLYIPFNIYEDRKLQILYYLIKINLYFLINSLLIKNSVINDIYDNNNYFLKDIKRCLIANIITFSLGLFIYYLTNIKRVLIRRRYKLQNIKIKNSNLNNEIIKMTRNFCVNYLYNKILLLFLVFTLIFLYSFYVSFSFCNAYYYTQTLLLKCVLLNITISQVFPIFACWIPSLLRKIAIMKKNSILYDINKYIELLFVA